MTKMQMIQVELENLNDEDLAEVLGVVKRLAAKSHAAGTKRGLLSKLKQVKIEGPEDFAANLDLYPRVQGTDDRDHRGLHELR